ncbi:hypothetical protein CISG_07356 [Coccidioides immitis RMSCC 3703]|uniref:Uncharacterized protein n=1 Tax=Coccidioides immitis RMSCC 3703 TaxID=454286 RepID=A0A0J8R1K5_COCIT|nr:hypothetical protein CISG_07356 [Coccidioides immitis RMSCC 3703]
MPVRYARLAPIPPSSDIAPAQREESIPPADPGIPIPATGLSKQCRLNNVGIRDLRYSLALALPLPRAGWLWIKSPWALATLHCLLKPTPSWSTTHIPTGPVSVFGLHSVRIRSAISQQPPRDHEVLKFQLKC